MEDCRDGVRTIAGKLKRLLDEGGRTYRGTGLDISFCDLLLSLQILITRGVFFLQVSPCMHLRNEAPTHYKCTFVKYPFLELVYLNLSIVN